MGLSKGNPDRLLSGTDVVGNVCGKKNEPISNVTNSGLNMETKKYLYFDWVKTAKILGQESLTKYLTDNDIVGNFSTLLGELGDFNKDTMVARDYCIGGAYTNTAKLEKDSSPVFNLIDGEFQYFDDSSLSQNAKGVVLSKQKLKDESEIVSLMQKDGTIQIYRTSKGIKLKNSTPSFLQSQQFHVEIDCNSPLMIGFKVRTRKLKLIQALHYILLKHETLLQ